MLLRLQDPLLGNISPAEFIPIAEKSGQILAIDQLVIKKACTFLKQHHCPQLQYLEINLSAAEFFKDCYQEIHGTVQNSGVNPQQICFEVTETAAIIHHAILAGFMERMRQEGYRFALDDFGTGYANITQVATLPFTLVKLDRLMLVAEEEKNQILFAHLLQMFGAMGLETVVEGVETPEQYWRAAGLGTTYLQGYHFARPMPQTDFIAFMQQHL